MFGISQLVVETPMFLRGVEISTLGATGLSHGQAKALIDQSFAAVLGRLPQGNEGVFAQAVALCETGYGASWDKVCGGAGSGSNNMGAVQAGSPPCNPDTSFQCGDTHEDGTGYVACFRKYATPELGMIHFIQVLYKQRPKVLQVAKSGSVREFSTALRASKYFELNLEKHIVALTKCLNSVTTALHVPMPPGETRTPATSRDWLSTAAMVGAGAWIFWKVVK